MKSVFISLGALVGVTIVALAQFDPQAQLAQMRGVGQSSKYHLNTPVAGGTNSCAANSTNTYSWIIDITRFDAISFQLTCAGSGASTGTVYLDVCQGIDLGDFETTPSITVALTLAGTATNTAVLNVTNLSTGYLGNARLRNANGVYLTNVIVRASVKRKPISLYPD